ncbi:hypothetical protein [Thermoanaerobacterium sp. RBIITD]|uniref:hypothetical protein n=1 Tax=Thermoanaerobacterium sp. RBIITD TaxID=1550240 RepID=UPI000BB8CE28|nr:hypothetical protein [Thermoanaerobacterium sp. RBIITD]SNX52628.1 hypothetical protein SAMN05660242_0038 [Thermoanaerobacterium sp. RBIITD]
MSDSIEANGDSLHIDYGKADDERIKTIIVYYTDGAFKSEEMKKGDKGYLIIRDGKGQLSGTKEIDFLDKNNNLLYKLP